MKHLLGILAALLVVASLVPARAQGSTNVDVLPLEGSGSVERELKAGEAHTYTIVLSAGQVLDVAVDQRGIDVVVHVFAPDGSKIAEIDSPNGMRGEEPIVLEAMAGGTYRIEVVPLGQGPRGGRYEIRTNGILSADAYAERVAGIRRKQEAVISWLKEYSVPLARVEAGNGFDDLQPLKQVFKDVRFVGLGEATHGTREFFQFKHRMLEFLVVEMGFRVFALEASYAACQNINDYVMGRTDDGAKALDSQGFWTWNTEEVRAMMDWMRRYNADVPEGRKVKFVGFGIQYNQPGKEKLLEYLRRVAPERVATTDAFFAVDLSNLNSAMDTPERKKEKLAKLDGLQDRYNDLLAFLEVRETELSARSSQAEYEQMREYARVIAQYIDSYSEAGPRGAALRDLYMADNFRRMVEREPAGTRFVLWAHNLHIFTGDWGGMAPAFGRHLRRFYGKDYYALGFSFNQGSFNAREMRTKDPNKRMLVSFTANPAPVDSIGWYLAQTGLGDLIVDFRVSRDNAEVEQWLEAPHPMRSIGSVYSPDLEPASFPPIAVGDEFDGLFFVDTTTASRPNSSVKNVAPEEGS